METSELGEDVMVQVEVEVEEVEESVEQAKAKVGQVEVGGLERGVVMVEEKEVA